MNTKNSRSPDPSGGLSWAKLTAGTLIKRYKRFLADVRLKNNRVVTAHCPNSGAMLTCSEPGRPVYLSRHDDPGRKLKFTWEMIDMPDSLVGVNTQVPNRLVKRAVEAGVVGPLAGYDTVTPEVRVGERSRLDLLLTATNRPPCYVEVKNCTLVIEGTACFPDAVTDRGRKHLDELMALVAAQNRCVMFFLIQRMDAVSFRPADHIDPAYGKALRKAVQKGVEVMAWDVAMDLKGIALNRPLVCRL
ncbi:MAG: DNA/RNA nuclease SfsA [Thermodesulfobacteriota bacterium]